MFTNCVVNGRDTEAYDGGDNKTYRANAYPGVNTKASRCGPPVPEHAVGGAGGLFP